MKPLWTLLTCLALATPALAQDHSALFRKAGLAGTIDQLQAKADPTPADRFTLGAAHFLRGVERSLQTRYAHGMHGGRLELPVLRLQVPPNPAPEPFKPRLITGIFADIDADMDRARAALEPIGEADFAVEIALGDIWFDINGNGTRDEGEAAAAQIAGTLLRPWQSPSADAPLPTVRFDSADAPWLEAYTHFLSGFSAVVLAFDPTEPITRVLADAAAMDELMALAPPVNAFDHLFADDVDAAVMIYRALEQTPDAAQLATARDHFLAMVRLNRVVWARVTTETDNENEWIPSATQSSALGIEMPPDTGEAWLAVLADGEALLTGEKLIPHWRLGSGAGVNLARMIEAAPPVDIVGWLQGGGLLPYAEAGERVSAANWRQFERLMQGDALLFALLLN